MTRVFLLGLVTLVSLVLLPGSALAGGRFGFRGGVVIGQPAPSVFPKFADPWRHWGVIHHPQPFIHPSPHFFHASPHFFLHPHAPSTVIIAPQPIWVPGFWAWNGFQWVWVPGHWGW